MSETNGVATSPEPTISLPISTSANRLLTLLVAIVAVGASLLSGIGFASGQQMLALLPILAVAGLLLAAVAVTRFSWFVLLLLVVRPMTDVVKFGGSMDPSNLIGIGFLVVAILWLTATLWGQKGIRPSFVTMALVTFTAAGALSIIGSSYIQASALQLVRLSAAIMMFVVLEQLITTRAMMKRVLVALFTGLTITIGYTAFTMATGGGAEVKGDFSRLTGPFTQSNDYARFLTFLILLGVAIIPYVDRRWRRGLFAVLAASSVLLIMTLTLGAIGATVVGCLIIALIQRRTKLVALLGIATVGALTAAPGLLGRISTSTTASELGGRATGNSVSWRLRFWESLLDIEKNNPITGAGLNTAQYFTPGGKQPHSDFLSAYVETGILGFVLYLGLLAALLATTAQAVLRAERNTLEWGVSVGALAVVAAFAVMSLAANVIQSMANFWYFLAVVACASATKRRSDLPWGAQLPHRHIAVRTPEPIPAVQ